VAFENQQHYISSNLVEQNVSTDEAVTLKGWLFPAVQPLVSDIADGVCLDIVSNVTTSEIAVTITAIQAGSAALQAWNGRRLQQQ